MAKKKKKISNIRSNQKKTRKVAGLQGVTSQQGMFKQALTLHQAGRLPEAENLYRQILAAEPYHPHALHYLGILAHQLGKHEIAVELINKALGCLPDYVDAHINLGIAFRAQDLPEEAVASFRRALSLKPDNAVAHYNLGNTFKEQGKLDEAVDCYRRALNSKPDYAEAHYNLGNTLKEQGKLDEAVACYRRALALKPDYAAAYNNLGNTLKGLGKLDEAVVCFRRALALKPDDAVAYNNLGSIFKDQGSLDEASACFQRALALEPDFAQAHYALGITLKAQGKPDEAIACFRRALSLQPDFAEALNDQGIILNDESKPDEAAACFRRALSLKPDFAEAHHNLGIVFGESGKLNDAGACFRKALLLKPDYARAYKNLSSIVRYAEIDDDVHAMEDLYNKEDLPDADRVDLGFALGKVYEDIGDYDRSFKFIREANSLKRKSYQYSIEDDHHLFARIKQTFSPEFFAAHHGSGNQDGTPIFIIGMPRSGTTLVEQILASHPLVFGAGELAVLETLGNGICTGGAAAQFPECLLDQAREAFARMGSYYIEKIRKYSKDAEHITDKLPNNFLRVGLIKTILPNAKIIHCKRNPMDTCFSIFKKDFTGIHGYANDMVELGRYYNLYQDLMAHWEKVLPGFIYTVRYEELISDQQNQTRNLLGYCGLPWDEACLAFHKTARRVSTVSLAQVRQPIYKDSVELWQRYEKQLEPLKKAIYG